MFSKDLQEENTGWVLSPVFESWHCHSLVLRLWTSHPFLSFRFLIHKMDRTVLTSRWMRIEGKKPNLCDNPFLGLIVELPCLLGAVFVLFSLFCTLVPILSYIPAWLGHQSEMDGDGWVYEKWKIKLASDFFTSPVQGGLGKRGCQIWDQRVPTHVPLWFSGQAYGTNIWIWCQNSAQF